MHIAIVRTDFIRSRGGAERYAVGLAQHWLAQGHRISVVCARHDARDAQGMEVHTVSRPKVLGPFKHRWFAAKAGQCARETGAEAVLCLARAYPGDVLRLGDGLHRSWLGARYPDLGQRKRALLNPRHRELMKLEQRLFLPGRFQLYVANSEMIRRTVVHMYGVDPARVVVIPNGVDAERYSLAQRAGRQTFRATHGISADAPLVLFSGMDFRRKGLEQAVRGFVALAKQRPDARFVCVGPGDTRDAQALLAAAGLTRQAMWFEQTEAMGPWYGAADVFLLPTMHDPSANAITECLACGTPVITSSENGARQHVRNGINGHVLLDRNDAAEMAARAMALIASPPKPDAVAESAGLISAAENAQRILAALQTAVRLRAEQAAESSGASRSREWDLKQAAQLQAAAGWLGDMHRRGYRGLQVSGTGARFTLAPGEAAIDAFKEVRPVADLCAKQFGRIAGVRALKAYLWALARPIALREALRKLG